MKNNANLLKTKTKKSHEKPKHKSQRKQGKGMKSAASDNNVNPNFTLEIENAISGSVFPYDSGQYKRMMNLLTNKQPSAEALLKLGSLKSELSATLDNTPEPLNIMPQQSYNEGQGFDSMLVHDTSFSSPVEPWPVGDIIKSPH